MGSLVCLCFSLFLLGVERPIYGILISVLICFTVKSILTGTKQRAALEFEKYKNYYKDYKYKTKSNCVKKTTGKLTVMIIRICGLFH